MYHNNSTRNRNKQIYKEDESTEQDKFIYKIKKFKEYSEEINDLISDQNQRLKGVGNPMGSSLLLAKKNLSRLLRYEGNKPKLWKYYLLSAVIIIVLLFIIYKIK